jgi:hypothetical protein
MSPEIPRRDLLAGTLFKLCGGCHTGRQPSANDPTRLYVPPNKQCVSPSAIDGRHHTSAVECSLSGVSGVVFRRRQVSFCPGTGIKQHSELYAEAVDPFRY